MRSCLIRINTSIKPALSKLALSSRSIIHTLCLHEYFFWVHEDDTVTFLSAFVLSEFARCSVVSCDHKDLKQQNWNDSREIEEKLENWPRLEFSLPGYRGAMTVVLA